MKAEEIIRRRETDEEMMRPGGICHPDPKQKKSAVWGSIQASGGRGIYCIPEQYDGAGL